MEKTFDGSSLNKKRMIICVILYFYFVIWFMFFRFSIPEIFYLVYPEIKGFYKAEYYLIPFESFYCSYMTRSSSLYYYLISFSNLLLFIPSSLGLQLLFPERKKLYTLLVSLVIFFLLEIIQQLTRLGVYDIDDIFLYTIGTGIGFVIYDKLRKNISDQRINKISIYLIQAACVVGIYAFVMIITQIIVLSGQL